MSTKATDNLDTTKENVEDVFKKYFIPPQGGQFTKWGQAVMVILLFGLMFIGILFAYIYANYTDYQNRISVITNAYLFGKDPQNQFEQYMKNSEGELISSVMNNIQSTSNNLETGWKQTEYQFEHPQETVGLMIMADGDNSGSSFTSEVQNLVIESSSVTE